MQEISKTKNRLIITWIISSKLAAVFWEDLKLEETKEKRNSN